MVAVKFYMMIVSLFQLKIIYMYHIYATCLKSIYKQLEKQQCGYWCRGAETPGHQYPHCWLDVQYALKYGRCHQWISLMLNSFCKDLFYGQRRSRFSHSQLFLTLCLRPKFMKIRSFLGITWHRHKHRHWNEYCPWDHLAACSTVCSGNRLGKLTRHCFTGQWCCNHFDVMMSS